MPAGRDKWGLGPGGRILNLIAFCLHYRLFLGKEQFTIAPSSSRAAHSDSDSEVAAHGRRYEIAQI